MKYLVANDVELIPSLWLYTVHFDNPEIIQFLEYNQIKIDKRTFSEAIKCHHHNINHYIYDNYLTWMMN